MSFNPPNYWGKSRNKFRPITSFSMENKKIRDPVKYLTKKYNIPKKYTEQVLAHAGLHNYWKKDNRGSYIDKETLDSIGYGWKKDKKSFMSMIKPPISPYMKKKYMKTLFPTVPRPPDLENDPLLNKYMQKGDKLKQHLVETGASTKKTRTEIKKLWKKGIEELKKKYPKDKAKIERLFKEQLKGFDIRMRMKELLEIGSRRPYTEKESKEIERLAEEQKQLSRNSILNEL